MVPGGGPSLEGNSPEDTHWVTSKHPTENRRKPYLTDNKELGKEFRSQFINGLRRLITKGKLRLEGEFEPLLQEDGREAWLKELESTNWNVFVEGPPHGRSKPEHVLKYLARYVSGGPIADSRLIRWTEPEGRVSGDVWFWARTRDKENKPEPFPLSGVEFVRRWSMHILPKGYTRSRSYGGFHGPQRRNYLELCRQVLGITEPAAEQASEPLELVEWKLPTCERCKLEMELISSSERPSWSDVFKYGVYLEPFVYVPILHFTFGLPAAHSIGGYG